MEPGADRRREKPAQGGGDCAGRRARHSVHSVHPGAPPVASRVPGWPVGASRPVQPKLPALALRPPLYERISRDYE
jgi:hypothetical protein